MIALAVVIFTASPTVLAAPALNNESEDVPTVVIAEVETDPLPVEAPTAEQRTAEVTPPVVVAPKPVVKHPKGCENYKDLVSQYEWNTEVALKVMHAESGCNPSAIGDTRVIGGIYAPSCGLFQIRTLQGRPNCDQLQNPNTNIEWAIKLYRASGWQPWSVCKNGKVNCY